MLTALGFHTDTDYQAELDTINLEIAALTQQVVDDAFRRPEDRTNTYRTLDNLHRRVPDLEWQAAVQNQRLDWVADAARMADDVTLGAIAYLVFGELVLPA